MSLFMVLTILTREREGKTTSSHKTMIYRISPLVILLYQIKKNDITKYKIWIEFDAKDKRLVSLNIKVEDIIACDLTK